MTQLIYRCNCCKKQVRVTVDMDLKGTNVKELVVKLANDKRYCPKIARVIPHECSISEVGIANLAGIYYRDDNEPKFY